MPTEPLSSIDQMWLRMEDPTHPMTITILLVFDAPIDFDRMHAVLRERLLCFPRFRQRVVQPSDAGSPAIWEDDPRFNLRHQIQQASLRAPGDEGALRALVGELMSQQLDLTRSPWQIHWIGSYGAGSALIARVHHCLADGPALMQVFGALTDRDPDEPAHITGPDDPPARVRQVRGVAAQVAEILLEQGPDLLHPLRFWALARRGTGTLSALGKLLFRTPDSVTVFKGALGVAKRVAWSRPLPLAEVKAAGQTVGGTVNDVMLAMVAGALRRYLESRGEPVEGLTVRAGLSVNLREPGVEAPVGNQAGAVVVELPLGVETAMDRLRQVKRCMDEIKKTPEASVIWGLMNALGNAPAALQDTLVEAYCSHETAVITNVLGPQRTVYVAGAPLSTLVYWVPALGGAGLCLSIASYAGKVWFGASTDEGLVPDPESIVAGFHAEYEAFRRTAVEPAPQRDSGSENRDTIEALSLRLDEVSAKLDALLDNHGPDPPQRGA